MKEYLEILKQCPLFHKIEEHNIIPLLSCMGAYKKCYNKGQNVFYEGEHITVIGMVLKGKVELSKFDYNGNKSILSTLEKTQMFGESFACAEVKKIPVDITAEEDCEVIFVDVEKILKTCGNACGFHNQMIANLLKAVATKNVILNKKIEITSKRTTREKLLTYLYLKAKEEGRNSFTIPYDRQSLADYLGVDRSGLSAEIGKLCKEETIDCHKNHFVLKKSFMI